MHIVTARIFISSWKVIGTPGSVVANRRTHGLVHVLSASRNALPMMYSKVLLAPALAATPGGRSERDISAVCCISSVML